MSVATVAVFPVLCTAGFIISPGRIPSYWRWVYYLSPLQYALEGMLSTQFHDGSTPLLDLDGVSLVTSSAYLDRFFGEYYQYSHRWACIGALVAFVAFAQLLLFYAHAYVRHEKR